MVNVLFQVMFTCLVITINRAEIPLNGPATSGFADVVGSRLFVDKSLLIRQVFTELSSPNPSGSPPPVVLRVRAGPRFGKTVNQNMIKRFIEITVDEKGKPVNKNSTINYKLFQNNELKIVNDVIYNKHFGRHPVIFINYKPLSEVTNFDHLLEKYRQILLDTFLEHNYLFSVKRLWNFSFNKTHFEMFVVPEKNQNLHKYYIYCGFSVLAKVLHIHFEKPVFVLIDDFDAIEYSPAFSTGEDKRRITNFIKEVNNDLLVSNDDVEAALLTGATHRGSEESSNTSLATTSKLWHYYGLSQQELQSLLTKFIDDHKRVKEAANEVVERFNGQYKNMKDHNPCSIWSVAQYLASDNKTNYL